jgi:RNA polymerase sigma-70 factor (ECF subfamily)
VSNPRQANEELARVLHNEHGAALLWFVQRRTRGERQLAEDIVQETVLRAWRHADDLPTTGAVRAWPFTTAHRAVLADCFYRGRTAAEIATERRMPPGTARSRIHYGLRALRLALQERGVTGS